MFVMNSAKTATEIKFAIKVFESRKWSQYYDEAKQSDEFDHDEIYRVLVVQMRRLKGDIFEWMSLKRSFLFGYCSPFLRGLPKWCREMELNVNKE